MRINEHLRGITPSPKSLPQIAEIRTGLSKGEAPEDFTAFRGVKQAKASRIDFDALNQGDLIQDAAVISTSLLREKSTNFAKQGSDPVVLEVLINKGTKGVYLNAGDLSYYESEKEWLMPPGSGNFRVIKKYIHNGMRTIQVERVD